MKDPLAGKRTAINDRTMKTIIWPAMDDEGRTVPCPVAKGDRFTLRSCVIEIETISRSLRGGVAEWHARFIRHERERVYLLRFTPPTRPPSEDDSHLGLSQEERAKREGMYTSSRHSASPHEPESVGPDWKDTRKAERELERQDARKARLDVERQDREVDRAAARVKQVGKTLGAKGVDLTDELADIYARLAEMERKAA